VLQCVAVCCIILCCSVLQFVAVCCSACTLKVRVEGTEVLMCWSV